MAEIPLWLNAERLNLEPFCTGRVKLELPPASTWQLSQLSDPMAIWLLGGATICGFMVGMANAAALDTLWHCAQFALLEGALAWIAATVGMMEKSARLVWHPVQLALADVGMWFAGLASPLVSNEIPAWHCEHSPLVGCAVSATLNCPAVGCGRV